MLLGINAAPWLLSDLQRHLMRQHPASTGSPRQATLRPTRGCCKQGATIRTRRSGRVRLGLPSIAIFGFDADYDALNDIFSLQYYACSTGSFPHLGQKFIIPSSISYIYGIHIINPEVSMES